MAETVSLKAVQRVSVSPCLQVKGQIFVGRLCQSSPSCHCGRRCQPSLCWRKHPAETWAPSVVQAGCVWTYTQDHLTKRGRMMNNFSVLKTDEKMRIIKIKSILPPLFRSSRTFSDRILTFFFFSSCIITLSLGARWYKHTDTDTQRKWIFIVKQQKLLKAVL